MCIRDRSEVQAQLRQGLSDARISLKTVSDQYVREISPQLTQNVDGVYDALSRFSGLLLSVSGASENLDETLSGVDGTLEQCLDCLLYTSFGAGAQREDHHRSDYRDDTHHVRAGAVGDSAVFGEKEGRGVVRIDLLSSV